MRIIAGILSLLMMTGCSQKDNIPSDVIGKEEMANIIWDMMEADQYAATYLVKDSAKINVKTETLKLYEEVFRLHKVTRDEFRKSYQFYQDRPDITRSLFDSLDARGKRERSESYSHPTVTPAPSAPVVRPPGAGPVPGLPAGTLPNRPPGAPQPARFFPGKDSARYQGKGLKFLPGRTPQSSPGGHFFPNGQAGKPIKAGDIPFRTKGQAVSDSLTKNKH